MNPIMVLLWLFFLSYALRLSVRWRRWLPFNPVAVLLWLLLLSYLWMIPFLSCCFCPHQLATLGALARPDEPGAWQGVEACLFAARSIGRDVPTNEETIVPQIVGMLPRLPGNHHVRYTATLIVGK